MCLRPKSEEKPGKLGVNSGFPEEKPGVNSGFPQEKLETEKPNE